MRTDHDVCVIGAGLVGLAVARALLDRYKGISVLILEKESEIAAHQSGHNSGVVHSGLYYRPGSLKARLCVEGSRDVHRLSDEGAIPLKRSGKLVVASTTSQIAALEELERRGRANGLTGLERLGPDGIRDVEPHATGVAALHVPQTSVVDFPALARLLARGLETSGVGIATNSEVTSITQTPDGVAVFAGDNRYTARCLINCAGLHSDRIARLAGANPTARIMPFRGEYYRLSARSAGLVNALIYPVPDPRLPFLGVHFTRKVDDTVEVGPNAVLAFGREHYRGTKPDWSEAVDLARDRRFLRLARAHSWWGAKEIIGSRSKIVYARRARTLVPAVQSGDLERGGSGVRAQAVGGDGALIDDFVIETVGATVHVLNAPSPGATASLAIGRHIVTTAILPL